MWKPDETRLVKVRLHAQGEDVETPWAEDLGPIPARPWVRRVRLGNVPFLHAKPTYEDVIAVEKDDGMLTWDRGDVPFERIGTRLEEDAGRWAMIIDYVLKAGEDDLDAAFKALDVAGEKADIAVEGAYADREGGSGRAYLAVPRSMSLDAALAWLEGAGLPLTFELVHPVDEG